MSDLTPTSLQGENPKVQTAALKTLRLTVLLISLPFFILGLLIPMRGKEIGASVVEIGLFFSVFSLMTVLLRPLVGWALDRFGRRYFFVFGVLAYSGSMLAFAFSDQVWGMMVARVLQGVASSLVWLSANAIVADVSPAGRRGRSFGGVVQASNQGAIAGTFIGFFVLEGAIRLNGVELVRGSWTLLFLGYGLVNLVAFGLALLRLPETHPQEVRRGAGRPIVWSRPWVLLLLVTAVTGASWAMVSPVIIIYLQEKLNVEIGQLAYAFLPSGLVWALLPSHLGRLADRFGRKPLMVLGLAMAAVSSFVLPFLSSLAGLAAIWALQALCYAAGDPAEQALVADLTGGDQRGRAYGLYAFAADAGATIGPLGGTILYQSLGQGAPFWANGVVLALCALALGLLLHEPPRPVSASPDPAVA